MKTVDEIIEYLETRIEADEDPVETDVLEEVLEFVRG